MKYRHLLNILVGLGALFSSPVFAADADRAVLEDEFRLALLRLVQSGELPANSNPVVIERPAERVHDFGLLVDRDSADGLLVLGTLPGGSAERLGLRAGDRLLVANGIDLRGNGGSQRMRAVLDDSDSDGRIDLRLLRSGREEQMAGVVDSVTLPAMRVELAAVEGAVDSGGRVAGDAQSRCGRVSVEPVAPRTRNLFPAKLIAVDDGLPGASSQQTFRLSPGRHVLLVAEMIEHEYFSSIANMQRGRHRRDGYKTLEVDIQPGVTYFLAARFHRDRSGSILDGGYWQPVLWKERVEPCR